MASIKKRPILHADAHVLARARLTPDDLNKINAGLKDSINAMDAAVAAAFPAPAGGAAALGTPIGNTGGKSINLVLEGGKIKEVLPRKHYSSKVCFIDWLNFTVHEDTFQVLEGAVTDQEVIMSVSMACESLFGFGITSKRDKGANFYTTSYILGENYGLVCYGGQRNTVMISLSGEGCAAARGGWERRCFDFLDSAQSPKITRIDLTHDDIEGRLFTPESLEEAYENGGFNCGGRNPDIELRGNWKSPNGKGRTINIGNRSNGKFFRGYEKGKQLGDKNSPWMRLEVEFKSVDRVIPFEILKFPHEYFAAAYPLLGSFSQTVERIATIKKTVEVSYDRTKKWLKRQCGAAINLMLNVEGSAEKVLELIKREGKLPKGVLPPSFRHVDSSMHHSPLDHMPVVLSFIHEGV
ncbi:replication initiation factor domain-containing protein [Methylobacillus gramineus]|uniref:replication initiation factor domain-containing protein n=1 Tax=Methylobacillus gramineus TaxID=755169 RepID=UPI001CFFADF7|nr:replication initiation factor domain-containing protein [Methylobacillus gramineus]MCB5186137.1 replication initiation factor domain-containing protein [Methylobacillus gramineus]